MTHLYLTLIAFLGSYWFLPIIVALGVFSLTRLVTTDSFPPIEKLRNWIYDRFPHDGYITKVRPTRGKWVVASNANYHVNVGHWFGELISCNWCAGWWVGLSVFGSLLFFPIVTTACLTPFAIRVIPGLLSRHE